MDIHLNLRALRSGLYFVFGGAALGAGGVAILLFSPRIPILLTLGMLVVGPLCMLVGFGTMVSRLTRKFELRIDERGVRSVRNGRSLTLPWQAISAIRIDWGNGDGDEDAEAELWVFPVPGYNPGVEGDVRGDGYTGYLLVPVGDIKEPLVSVQAHLARLAGNRYASVLT